MDRGVCIRVLVNGLALQGYPEYDMTLGIQPKGWNRSVTKLKLNLGVRLAVDDPIQSIPSRDSNKTPLVPLEIRTLPWTLGFPSW